MADEKDKTAEGASGKKKGGLLTLVILFLVALIFGAAGFAVPLLFPQILPGHEPAKTVAVASQGFKPYFVNFGDVVVNLNSDRFNRYLRVNVTLQVDEQKKLQFEQRLAVQKAILKNWLLSYLSDQVLEEIRGAAGQNRLRREIQNQFNMVLCPDGIDLVQDVLFEEFSVQ